MKWAIATLGEVAKIERKGIDASDIVPGTEFLGLEHIQIGGEIIGSQRLEYGDISSTKFRFTQAHVLYGKLRPYLAKIALPDFEGICSTDILPIAPGPNLDRKYLAYYLRQPSMVDLANSRSTGANLPRLSPKVLETFKIPLPPLEEQRRIAAILDKADGVRRKRKEAIRLTEELLRSTFLEMFGDSVTNPKGWEVKRLGEICTNFQNGIGKNSEHYGHGSKVANISDLYEWHRFIPEKYSLLDVTPKEIEKYSLMRGDLLFVRSSVKREGVAVCSVYDSDEICLFSSFMIRVRPRTDLINPEFLSLMLRTPPMRNRLILGSNTSTITNISQPGLSKIEVVVPPIKTQNLITKVTKNIEESVRCHLQALEQSENLFNSLLQRAFRGEL